MNPYSCLKISVAAIATAACSPSTDAGGTGEVSVLLEPEGAIIDGLRPGSGVEAIRDGWRVTFKKYLLGVGNISIQFASDLDVRVEDDAAYIVDLKKLPAGGEPLWRLRELRPGRWTFGYELVGGGHGVKRHSSVREDDFAYMKANDLTYFITGTLEKAEGVSCPPERYAVPPAAPSVGRNEAGDPCYSNTSIQFEFAVRAETAFSNCKIDGLPGFSVSQNGVSTVAATLHGDHLFFNGFPSGSEGGIQRLAQIWADTDIDLNGSISNAEFADLLVADMAEWDARYQGGGSPLDRGVSTMHDLAEGQLKSQGHMDGEGECAVDGTEHEHDDHDESEAVEGGVEPDTDGKELDSGVDNDRLDGATEPDAADSRASFDGSVDSGT